MAKDQTQRRPSFDAVTRLADFCVPTCCMAWTGYECPLLLSGERITGPGPTRASQRT